MKKCVVCEREMMECSYGDVCINTECPSVGHVIQEDSVEGGYNGDVSTGD